MHCRRGPRRHGIGRNHGRCCHRCSGQRSIRNRHSLRNHRPQRMRHHGRLHDRCSCNGLGLNCRNSEPSKLWCCSCGHGSCRNRLFLINAAVEPRLRTVRNTQLHAAIGAHSFFPGQERLHVQLVAVRTMKSNSHASPNVLSARCTPDNAAPLTTQHPHKANCLPIAIIDGCHAE